MVMEGLYRNAGEVSSGFDFDQELLQGFLQRLYGKGGGTSNEIDTEMFSEIWRILDEAAREGFSVRDDTDPDADFYQALLENNAVFAAFKVHRMQKDMAAMLVDQNGTLRTFEQWLSLVMPVADHQVRQWLETEYDTAVLRARQAADWQQFEREKDVLPNLKWMPSTSLHPAADHRIFWGTIRPIDDPFWSEHRPGDRWNCKCGLSSTDEPPTPVPDSHKDKAQKGLENNPGKDARLFSRTHPYIENAYPEAEEAVDRLMARIREMVDEMPENLAAEEKMAIAGNNLVLEKALGITKGKPMAYEEADKGKENPDFALDTACQVNCQTCVPVHLLRRRGFDVEAAPNKENSAYKLMEQHGITWNKNLFTNYDGSDVEFAWARAWASSKGIKRMGTKEVKRFLVANMREDGIYEIYCAWKKRGAHVFCAEKKGNSLKLFDPQPGTENVENYIGWMKGLSVGVLRIDNKKINPKAARLFIKHR